MVRILTFIPEESNSLILRERVSFFLFFFSDYDVLMLDDNYQIALVGSKSPNYLWILSRDPSPSDKVVGEVIEEADRRGYDTSKLIWVDQSMFPTLTRRFCKSSHATAESCALL